MTPAKRDSPPPEKTPAAKPESKSGGGGEVHAEDWREQSEPHPAPAGTGPAVAAKPQGAAGPALRAAPPSPPGPPFVAGTAISVTPYAAPGKATQYMVGTVLVGSQEAAAMALKNLLFLPPSPRP